MKLLFLLLSSLLLFSFIKDDATITGRWKATMPDNINLIFNFRQDSSFETTVNKKLFSVGKYTYTDSVCTLVEDNGCRNDNGSYVKGMYKITFPAQNAIQFEAIQDTCNGRRQGLNHLKLSKVEKGISQ
jgi:hypothetical protein